ncbi:hypothetical protein BDF22DRAFT_209433 [Syncephalis plumigaleata]|nr:hypothetical protein BDF22DRAFT_209433 [Syncephalis plumigaleata]
MLPIPNLVIERIAIYVDTNSFIAYALCSKELFRTISQLQYWWKKRYQERYSLNDDREADWMIWYMKTLRVSGLSSPLDKESLRNDKYAINWFRAFCHRRATDASWFKNDPRQLQDIQMDTPSKHRVAVLQRITFNRETLGACGVIEQCQHINGSSSDRFWRLRKPYHNGIDPNITVKDIVIANHCFIVVIDKPKGCSSNYTMPGHVLVWPIHCLTSVSPRCLPYPCNRRISIRGNWMLLHHCEEKHRMQYVNDGVATTAQRPLFIY